MSKRYIVALDEGTTSARTLVYDTAEGKIVSVVNKQFKQIYPMPGWVEHDAQEVWRAQEYTLAESARALNLNGGNVEAIGITNQRETVLVWDKRTGEPVHNAIVWQCRRAASFCEKLSSDGYSGMIKNKTGLVIDSYFSAAKIKWILDNVVGARSSAERGDLIAGTMDTYLIWKLTGGRAHITDYSNACRTMLFNIRTMSWDEELADLFTVPLSMLPKVVNSSGFAAETDILGGVPITGVAGDQQSSLFGQGCFKTGMAKNTYGTGCFILLNTGAELKESKDLLTTLAWGIDGKPTYALEGSVFNAGSAVQWLRDEMLLIKKASDTEELCYSVEDTNGVYFVPAFTGLGAPYWNMDARGAILGLTRGANRAHVVRAAMESMAYNTKAILDKMARESGIKLSELRCDGGVSKDDFLMQFQADMLSCPTCKQESSEGTALGAVYLAGLGTGAFKDCDDVARRMRITKKFYPDMAAERREKLYKGWQDAVKTITRK